MTKPGSMPLLAAMLALWVSACATRPDASGPVVTAAPASKAEIKRRLAPVCPQPTQWTPDQMEAVADAIDAVPDQHRSGINALSTEWERLNDGAKTCRGQKAGS